MNPFVEYFYYFTMPRKDVNFFCATINAYPHIAKVTTVDRPKCLLECIVPEGQKVEFDEVIAKLRADGVSLQDRGVSVDAPMAM